MQFNLQSTMEQVKSLGADKVIDYTKEDFTKSDERYDFVFSVVGKTTFSQCKRILKSKSIYLENATGLETPGRTKTNALISRDYYKANYLANLGMNHTLSINKNSFIKTSLSYSGTGLSDDVYETDTIRTYNPQGELPEDYISPRMHTIQSRIVNSAIRGAITYNNKINAKNKIQTGTKYTLYNYDYNQNLYSNEDASMFNINDFKINVSTINNFISWKHSLNEKINIVAGLHNMNILSINKSTLEPRLSVNWTINNTNSVYAGYGMHSTTERIQNYYTKILQVDGTFIQPNKNLGLLKAHHYVLGYEKRFSEYLTGKVEIYYQDLYNLPVENNDSSTYATINEGIDYKYVELVNKGSGRNYGMEISLERFFDKNFYFLINSSL